MIEARKHRAIEMAFAFLNRRMLRRHFNSHRLRGREELASLDRSSPAIFYANHSNWWDGLIAFHLSRDLFRLDAILMMEARQLERYRFFRLIGAFGVDRASGQEVAQSLRYAVDQIRNRGRVLWIYPQGVMLPNDTRPLTFQHGVTRLVRTLEGCQLVPVTHRYEFLAEQRPDAFTAIGPVRKVRIASEEEVRPFTEQLAEDLAARLDRLRADVISQNLEDFEVTLRGAPSANRRYDAARGRPPSPAAPIPPDGRSPAERSGPPSPAAPARPKRGCRPEKPGPPSSAAPHRSNRGWRQDSAGPLP